MAKVLRRGHRLSDYCRWEVHECPESSGVDGPNTWGVLFGNTCEHCGHVAQDGPDFPPKQPTDEELDRVWEEKLGGDYAARREIFTSEAFFCAFPGQSGATAFSLSNEHKRFAARRYLEMQAEKKPAELKLAPGEDIVAATVPEPAQKDTKRIRTMFEIERDEARAHLEEATHSCEMARRERDGLKAKLASLDMNREYWERLAGNRARGLVQKQNDLEAVRRDFTVVRAERDGLKLKLASAEPKKPQPRKEFIMRRITKAALLLGIGYSLSFAPVQNIAASIGGFAASIGAESPGDFARARLCGGCGQSESEPICRQCGGSEFRDTVGREWKRGLWPVSWKTRFEERPGQAVAGK